MNNEELEKLLNDFQNLNEQEKKDKALELFSQILDKNDGMWAVLIISVLLLGGKNK